jgi:predicted MPP superfamily phosphohydrolase
MAVNNLQIGFKYFPFKEIDLDSKNFHNSIKGIRIIQLSDFHLHKKVTISYLELLIAQINAKHPDLVLFTGDIIECNAKKIKPQLDIFKNIKAPAYYVTGNHDIFYGKNELKEVLEKNNIICLDNSCIRIKIRNEFLQLVGVSDRYSFLRGKKRPLQKLFSGIDKNLFTILLAHQPKDIEHIKKARVDIQLSGHTHGGQIFPLSCFVKIFQPYFTGFYTKNKTLLYVTTGLGYWGVGVRYKAQSEIPVFTIH